MDSLYIGIVVILILSFGILGIIKLYRYMNSTKTVLKNREECP